MIFLKKVVLIICFIFSLSFAIYAHGKNNLLNIKIEGKKYKELSLRMGLDNGKLLTIEGKSENNQEWTFSYPDSAYEKQTYMYMFVNEVDTIDHRLAFRMMLKNDTLRVGGLEFKKNKSTINLRYMKTLINEKSPETWFKTEIRDVFFVQDSVDPQLMAIAKCMESGYSMFAYDTLTDVQRYQKYIRLTKEFPYSSYAIRILSSTMTRYQSKDDVQKIFSCFNKEVQNSWFGKKVSAYLVNSTFKNTHLPSCNDLADEPIVKDTTKYTLVLFSASWCAPCHKQIPLLKAIYKDQSGKLDMVYISIDEQETVDAWTKLMKTEHIPWRSLLAVDHVKSIKEKYYVQGIPCSILVYPSGFMEAIDVRKKENLDKSYKLLR